MPGSVGRLQWDETRSRPRIRPTFVLGEFFLQFVYPRRADALRRLRHGRVPIGGGLRRPFWVTALVFGRLKNRSVLRTGLALRHVTLGWVLAPESYPMPTCRKKGTCVIRGAVRRWCGAVQRSRR
jgi:hypothetical protein